jgi:type II secretory ATPase GspE/PulE/Tfp pilus assembly ATPase PilB-like protein
MQRKIVIGLALGLGACALLAATPEIASAQWPAYSPAFPPEAGDEHAIDRGPGFYFAIWKILLLLLLVWLWVKSADFVSKDTAAIGESIGMPATVWNPVMVFSFFLAFMILALGIPIFAAGYLVAALAYFVPFLIYVVQRNGKVPVENRVLTPSHILNSIKNIGRKGPKQEVVAEQPWEKGPKVDLSSVGPDATRNQQQMIESRQSPAYVPMKILLADALANRAEKIRLDYTAQGVSIRYLVDGVFHQGNPPYDPKTPFDRALGDAVLAILKRLAGLNFADRRSRQEGKLKIEFQGNKYDSVLLTQGTQTGEVALLTMTQIVKGQRSLDELGMREKMRDQFKEMLNSHGTVVVISAMPQDGLTTTWMGTLKLADRLMRDFYSFENAQKREPEIENVEIVKYDPSAGETPDALMPKIMLRQPDVLICPEPPNGETVRLICEFAAQEHFGFFSVRAREAVEALLRVLALGVPAEKFAPVVAGVLNHRLVRKLCPDCKEAFQPPPDLLARLRIPPGRVQVLYRERQPPPPGTPPKDIPPPCPKCRGIGYFGRQAIFELLVVNDAMKQALLQNPRVEVLRQIAQKSGHPSLMEEGILLVATGVTSVTELQRVLTNPGSG